MSNLTQQTTEETTPVSLVSTPQEQKVSASEIVQAVMPQVSVEGEALLAALHKEVRQRSIWLRSALTTLILLYCSQILHLMMSSLYHVWIALLSVPLVFFLIWALLMLQDSRKNLRTLMTQQTDVRAIRSLLDGKASHERLTIPLVKQALTALLPRLRSSDSTLLNQKQRESLYAMLKERKDRAFVLAALSALEQIGDSEAIWPVEQLVEGQYLAAKDDEVRQRAKECLDYLRIHAPEVDAQQTLLRASNSETAQPEQLLRPIETAGETSAEQLLRATIEI